MNAMMKFKLALAAASLAFAVSASAVGTKSIKETLDGFTDTGCIAGVVSVLSDPDYNVQVDCSGWADAERRVPITERTLFAIFSMTKTFTGVAMLCDRRGPHLARRRGGETPARVCGREDEGRLEAEARADGP